MSGLFPPNGATGQLVNPVIRMEYCGMTELEINYFHLKAVNGSILPAELTTGDYWAELELENELATDSTYTVEAEGRINDSGTVKQILPGTWAFSTLITDDVLYYRDFNDTGYTAPHTFSKAEIENYLNSPNFIGAQNGQIHLVDDPAGGNRGPVMKVDYKSGCIGIDNCGTQAHIDFGDNGVSDKNEVYLAYDIYFPNDYVFPRAQKLIGLMGDSHTGSRDATPGVDIYLNMEGSGGGSVPEGQIFAQTDGADGMLRVFTTSRNWIKGSWNRAELRVKLNDVGSSNGVCQMWHNQSLIYSDTSKVWVNTVQPNEDWEKIFLHFYVGGKAAEHQHPKNQSMYIDNITLSDNPITH